MDNISHSAVGLLVGEILHRSLKPEETPQKDSVRHRLILFTAGIASNFPDLDLVFTPLLPPPLGYLLHHRGHTHTLLYAIPQAILMFLILWFSWKSARELLKESRLSRFAFGGAMLVGFALHMMMDYLNSYGIHPFHPFVSDWYFGDMVFIVEPVFWLFCSLPLVAIVKNKWVKVSLSVFFLAMPVLTFAMGALSAIAAVLLLVVAIALFLFQTKLNRSAPRSLSALVTAAFVCVAFVAMQSYTSFYARKTMPNLLDLLPQEKLLDVSLSPFPTNPFCWMFVSMKVSEVEKAYVLERGILSLWPSTVKADQCPSFFSKREKSLKSSDQMTISTIDRGDLNLLRKTADEDCFADAWFRFSRMPLVTTTEAIDLRFKAVGPRENFTTLKLGETRNCDLNVPLWSKPRQDLFD